MIYLQLFLNFLMIGALPFGGGYGMISLVRETVLRHGWLTEAEFLSFVAVSESTPGPLAINMATFIGSSQGGLPGALIATLGVVLPSFFIILLIAAVLVLVVYPLMEESDRRPVVLTYTILAMVVCSGAFVGYLYLRGDTDAAAEDTANYLSALENGWKLLGATVGMLVSNIADRKHIRFETQAVWWAQLIKLAVGFGCLLAIRSGLKAPLIALLGGSAAIAGGIRYLLVVLFAGCVWPLTFWWFSRLGKR